MGSLEVRLSEDSAGCKGHGFSILGTKVHFFQLMVTLPETNISPEIFDSLWRGEISEKVG